MEVLIKKNMCIRHFLNKLSNFIHLEMKNKMIPSFTTWWFFCMGGPGAKSIFLMEDFAFTIFEVATLRQVYKMNVRGQTRGHWCPALSIYDMGTSTFRFCVVTTTSFIVALPNLFVSQLRNNFNYESSIRTVPENHWIRLILLFHSAKSSTDRPV